MIKLTKLKDVLSRAGIDINTLGSVTEEQLQRLVLPSLRALKKEIDARKKIPETS